MKLASIYKEKQMTKQPEKKCFQRKTAIRKILEQQEKNKGKLVSKIKIVKKGNQVGYQ